MLHRVELDEGERLPEWGRTSTLIVAMGGPMSVNDEAEYPWLVEEKRLIAEAVRAGVPFWGSCLGVQLLASSLGARVYGGEAPEVGVLPVTLTDEGPRRTPCWAGLPRELPTVAVARRHVRPAGGGGAPGGIAGVSALRLSAMASGHTACSSTSRSPRPWPGSGHRFRPTPSTWSARWGRYWPRASSPTSMPTRVAMREIGSHMFGRFLDVSLTPAR